MDYKFRKYFTRIRATLFVEYLIFMNGKVMVSLGKWEVENRIASHLETILLVFSSFTLYNDHRHRRSP